ncbi:MAG: DUF4390 domain-containing protein [Polaromonas sp.]|uniref:DUF4390 domain-containing protein n=1 Tax=Polaromonas sp. TaxID=1869339 RepID=UPI00326530B8
MKNAAADCRRAVGGAVRVLLALCLCLVLGVPGQVSATEITQLRVERGDDGVHLSALVRFELPAVVEDALLKGIPLFFVVEADIYRDRWYWTDPRVVSAARTIRLAYQPLTRRWRVNIASGLITSSGGLRATLNQNYETLSEALSAIQRVARWKIAEAAEIDPEAVHKLDFSFRLDLTQLPRPFQIGVAGQKDWTISAQVRERLKLEPATPAAASVEGTK